MKEIALYIHVPFCVQKCHYCDFLSFPYEQDLFQIYLEGLERELELHSQVLAKGVKTVYFGGGTPSCLSVRELNSLFAACRPSLPEAHTIEMTFECNPGTISREKLQVLKAAGINRLSLGVQALQDEHLVRMGRTHRVADFYNSYSLIREAGFDNVSFDLIFALPGQTLGQWEATIKGIIALEPEHVSTYNLVYEEGTPFYQWRGEGKLQVAPEELDLAMYRLAMEMLPQAGYRQYEISNFAKKGRESQHNKIYWYNEPYLGLGPGAHSFVGGVRWANTVSLEEYSAELGRGDTPVVTREILTPELEQAETVILGLRLREGIERQGFQRRFGKDLYSVYADILKDLGQQGLLEVTLDRVRLTTKGLLFANRVFLEFIPA